MLPRKLSREPDIKACDRESEKHQITRSRYRLPDRPTIARHHQPAMQIGHRPKECPGTFVTLAGDFSGVRIDKNRPFAAKSDIYGSRRIILGRVSCGTCRRLFLKYIRKYYTRLQTTLAFWDVPLAMLEIRENILLKRQRRTGHAHDKDHNAPDHAEHEMEPED